MKSETISYIVVFLGGIGFLLQFAQFFNNENEHKWYKKVTWVGWVAILLCIAIIIAGVQSISIGQEDKRISDSIAISKENKNNFKTDGLKAQNNKLTIRLDSFNNSFQDSLKSTAVSMSREFGEGIRHGDANTVSILTDALSNKKQLLIIIDSLNKKLDSLSGEDPELEIMGGWDIDYKKSLDTGLDKFFIGVQNRGKGRAMNVAITFTTVNKVAPQYINIIGKYFKGEERNVYLDGRKEEIPGGTYSGVNGKFDTNKFLQYDTVYFMVKASYTSRRNRIYKLQHSMLYTNNTGYFAYYNGGNIQVDSLLKKK